ncbi:MAG: oligosaccharide flippase family protein, partial [Anaerolineae bacterium]|nr:oligosaccharide flippase family protein [Anaerolineae bacterium]
TSFPLMINLMLATIFFRIDVLLLKPMKGDTVVGYYSAALKYVDGLLIIPQYFTQAIFPLMSRYAATSRDSLLRAYVLSLRLLLIIALPIAAAMPFIAEGLIMVL